MEVYAIIQAFDPLRNEWSVVNVDADTGMLRIYPSELTYWIRQGRAFSASKRWVDVAADSSVWMQIKNPVGSSVVVHIAAIECCSSGLFDVDIYSGATITDATSISPRNLHKGSSNVSQISIGIDGTLDLTGAQHELETIIPGGTSVRAIGEISEVGEEVILSEGNDLTVVLTNRSDRAGSLSIRAVWWEE